MDAGIERIRRVAVARREADPQQQAALAEQAIADDRQRIQQLEADVPARLAELAAASDGELEFEESLFKSPGMTAIQVRWRSGKLEERSVELWLLQASGSVEWRWAMGYRQPVIVQRVSASRFDLDRLDKLVAGLGDPGGWRAGYPPDV